MDVSSDGGPRRDDLAVPHDRDPVREALGLLEVVRREQDRLAEVAQRRDRLPRSPASLGVEARRRLVEEDELRIADEREPEVEAAPLPAGEASHERVALLLEADELDDVADRARLRVVAGEEREILGDGEAVVEGRGLEDDADPLAPVEARGGRILAEHGHRPAVALAVALEDLDGRRLAGAVRAEQPEDLALRDLEADSAQRLELVVGLAEIVDGHGARHIWPI